MSNSKSNSVTSTISFPVFLIIIALTLTAMTILLYFVSLNVRVEFTQLVSIVEVPASLTVSAILAYLYFRQADLMDGQQKLMELDYTPKLSLGEVNITEERTVDGNTKGTNKFNLDLEESNSFPVEKLSIPLKNIGEGVATELQLDLNIIPIEPDSKQTRRYSALQRPLELQDRHKYGYISTGTMSFPIAEHHHNHLTSGTHEDFVATVTFRFDSDQEETGFVFLPFSLILELLKNQKVERARLQIGVDYSDTAQSEYTLSIVTIDFELENTNTLCDVLENGKIIYPTDLDEKMTGDYTPTISEVNSWTSSEPSKNS